MIELPASRSEDNGIALLTRADRNVLSVGISTAGVAEIRMASLDEHRRIIATTVDPEGLAFADDYIAESGFQNQIETRLEDVSDTPLGYEDGQFDFIYARLVLHYLPKDKLDLALGGLHRVLRPGGRLFTVVRSTQCLDANREDAVFDPITRFTSHSSVNKEGEIRTHSRYFHTEESINNHLTAAGFRGLETTSYPERLYSDFKRTKLSAHTDHVIQTMARKGLGNN